MRILYIVSELGKCGASFSFLNLLKGLRKMGVEAFVVAPDWNLVDPDFTATLKELDVEYRLLPIPWDIKDENNTIKFYIKKIKLLIKILLGIKNSSKVNKQISIDKLKEIILFFKPDIVHTNVGVIHIGNEICKQMKIKHVWHIREYQDLDFHWKPLPSKDIFIKQLKETDAVITITNSLKKYFNLENCPTAKTIYNGVYDKNNICLELPKDNFFLCASRLVPAKGHVDVVKSFGIFYKENPSYKLIFAGTGDEWYINKLKTLAKSLKCEQGISFVGHIKDIRKYMKKAKALIVASYNEGFGRMTAEAAFCGCLVIGRNTGGTKEILDEIGGFKFDNTPKELYEQMQIIALMKDDDYLQMANTAQNRAIELYSNENYVNQVFNIYQQITKKENA